MFNRFRGITRLRSYNNRDHRKICVIDGNIAYTGGINLSDRYINEGSPYGHWKDNAVRLEGSAVWSLTVMFLSLWYFLRGENEDFLPFAPDRQQEDDGYLQPYTDLPQDDELVGAIAYMQLLDRAKHHVYITTPYLVIDHTMAESMCKAAKSGIDVHIITPGIPDKKLVYQATRSYYNGLVRNGVRIFEYTPGFCHAKQCISDDSTAVCGTINLDYRSLYHHFENGVLMYGYQAVKDMKACFDEVFPKCCEVTEQYRSGRSSALRIGHCMLRLISPLL